MNPPCDCLDYYPEDPDDSLCFVCVCGHLEEEHKDGFLQPCKFTPEEKE